MASVITGELVVESASRLRWKTRAFLFALTVLLIGGGYSRLQWIETKEQNARLDAQIVKQNIFYNQRIQHLSSLIDLFEKEFFGEEANKLTNQQRGKLDEYRAKLHEHKRKVEVEQIANKIGLLATHVDPEYALVIASSIYSWSEPNGIDPDMLVALTYTESRFKRQQVSNKGALGLTQVMPAWVKCRYPRTICKELNFVQTREDLADNVDKNIRAGSTILKFMLKKANGKWDQALASYNLGWVKVGSQVEAGEEYDYTYAKKVLQIYTRLKQMDLRQAASVNKASPA